LTDSKIIHLTVTDPAVAACSLVSVHQHSDLPELAETLLSMAGGRVAAIGETVLVQMAELLEEALQLASTEQVSIVQASVVTTLRTVFSWPYAGLPSTHSLAHKV
jgi:ABC-type molybdate transport system ATPase subunit